MASHGPKRKLVLAFDVGTTFSGISYSVLDPGQIPKIKAVTRFPAHEHISGASKVPTIIYYDRNGTVQAVGAEAMREGIYETAEYELWDKAEGFKLHFPSKVAPGAGKKVTNDIPPLPLNKAVVEVFADFLAYLFECASSYIQDTHANGADLWTSVKSQIEFVLSHPNDWEGTQQSEMRKAAVLAKLIPDTTAGHGRLSFVTEGEARLHFAVQNGLPACAMTKGDGVIIVDAGGGTIDVSSYSRNTTANEETFEEVAAPQCHFDASVVVSINFRLFLENFLSDSPFAHNIDHIVSCFDKTTKLRFRNADEVQYIKFGSTRDNNPSYNIRFGQLKLIGSDVASFFDPFINYIVKAIRDRRKAALKPISHVALFGEFTASDWMFEKVYEALAPEGLNVIRPERHVNQAVSDGAVSFCLNRKGLISSSQSGMRVDLQAVAESAESSKFIDQGSQSNEGHIEQRDIGYGVKSDPAGRPQQGRSDGRPDLVGRTGNGNYSNHDKSQEQRSKLQVEIQRLRGDVKRLTAENRNLKQRYTQSERDRQCNKDTVNSLSQELSGVKRELEEYRLLSETRGKELFDAQVVSTKPNSLSVYEVIEKVHGINDVTYQAAASVSESFILQEYNLPPDELESYCLHARHVLGGPIVKLLTQKSSAPEIDPFLVQIVFQVLLSQFCVSKIEPWYLGSEETDVFWTGVYGEIRRKENQQVSGKWRALAHAHTRPSPDGWTTEFLLILEHIRKISGWTFVEPAKQQAFIQTLDPVFRAIMDIRVAVREHVTSADIEVFAITANQLFCPQIMEDAWGDSCGAGRKDSVAGTTGIGLKQLASHQGVRSSQHNKIILLPKVILHATLQEYAYLSAHTPTFDQNSVVFLDGRD